MNNHRGDTMLIDSKPHSPDHSALPTLMDTWGHFILMTPICLAMTLFTAQWQFIVTFASIETAQFVFHAKEHHSEHPLLTSIQARIAVVSPILLTTFVVNCTGFPHLVRVDRKLEMFALIGLQIGISAGIHAYFHAKAEKNTKKMINAASVILGAFFGACLIGALSWLT